MNSDFFREELYKMRSNYQRKPLRDIKLDRPEWLDESDPMSEIYSKKSILLQQGEIVYASIVQANTILFERYPSFDCPANIVYSTDLYIAENPQILYAVAQKLYDYKGKDLNTVPNEWKEIARVITDEYDRSDFTFSLELDKKSFEFHMIPTMIYRKLLPKKKLCGTLLPILTVPECKQVLILPEKYWTKSFTKEWISGNI